MDHEQGNFHSMAKSQFIRSRQKPHLYSTDIYVYLWHSATALGHFERFIIKNLNTNIIHFRSRVSFAADKNMCFSFWNVDKANAIYEQVITDWIYPNTPFGHASQIVLIHNNVVAYKKHCAVRVIFFKCGERSSWMPISPLMHDSGSRHLSPLVYCV